MWSHKGSHLGTAGNWHEWETGSEKTEDLQDSRSLQQKKNKLNMALPNCYLAVAGNVFLPHEMTVHSSVPVSGIVVRPPGTLKMSGHCREMWLVRQGQFETDLLKLVWSHTEHARSPSSMKGRGRPGYSLLETTRIGLLMIGLRFSSVMNPILNWCPLQPTYWLGGSLEKLTTQTVLPLQ